MFAFCRICTGKLFNSWYILQKKGVVLMIMSWVYLLFLALSLGAALLTGRGSELAAAIPAGAKAGIDLVLVMAGSLCLWTGAGKLMEKTGLTALLSRLFSPFLGRIFPSYRHDPVLAGYLCSNVCANFLGLGNAATPMGIQAAKRVSHGKDVASDELCRLIVLNTASIQLIPATVAAIRAQFGSYSPFDILPAVWITSITSAGAGLLAAWCLGRLSRK
jgi:spore maturation protein A